MSTLVLADPAAAIPPEFASLETIVTPSTRARLGLKDRLDGADRLIVVGDDALLAAAVGRLMVSERLDIVIGFAATESARAQAIYGLAANPATLLESPGTPRPLIRDDNGFALMGLARLSGPAGNAGIFGECLVDDDRLFKGEVSGIEVEPIAELPGLRARLLPGAGLAGRLKRRPWLTGRCAQTGSTGLQLIRDGVPAPRELARSTFYRHVEPWHPILGG